MNYFRCVRREKILRPLRLKKRCIELSMAKEKLKQKVKTAALPKNIPFWQNEKILPWIFFAFAFLLYAQTIGYSYALDDRAVTFDNNFVKEGFGGIGKILKTFYWAGFPSYAMANSGLFRPLSLILFAVEWKFFPNQPHIYHFVNVVLYSTSALLLYKTLRELFREYSMAIPVGATLLWIAFPAHTEVAANIKSADEILSVIFFLLMMRQLLKWTENKLSKPLLLSGIFFFFSLLSKEGAVLFLPVALIAVFLFRKTEPKKLFQPTLILFFVSAAWFAWHYAVIANAAATPITYSYHDNSLFSSNDKMSRIATAILMQGKYLLKSFTGFPLSYDYSFNENPVTGLTDIFVLLSFFVCTGLLLIAIRQFRKNPILSFGILFYFITFALTSNIFMLIGATMADRFLFVPSIGFSIAIAWGILKLTKSETLKSIPPKAMYILLPLVLLYSVRTFSRSKDWSDETNLFTKDVENAPGSARVHFNYGVILKGQADQEKNVDVKNQLYEQAFGEFKTAVKIDSLDYQSYAGAGEVEFKSGKYPESAYWRKKSLEAEPKNILLLRDLGTSLMKSNKFDSAIFVYKQAIDKNASDSLTWMFIGEAYLLQHDTMNALNAFENDVKKYPGFILCWNKLGNLRGMHHDMQQSTAAFQKIIQLDPDNLDAYRMLYTNYKTVGDSVNAKKCEQEFYRRGGK